ncbi:BlaI/MecI/CopY family transcriptional regulator [Streptomyces sp. SID8014]|uniref:BlaI/MecI/CopY family transcriptional regulator n=1 Tax=Streptomyces sp. SID8014 TaxID=2706097 RepID=UPI001943ECCF|nr:BlaI/MecI/CopY family transcriptional regulator [Streptomyces sp. SID8014]
MGELEDAVMTRVWKWNRPVTVREVLEDLQQERSIAYTTVMTVMDNLYQKGWVRREAEGRAYRYTAVSTRAAYAAALMNEAWQRSDNQAAALVAFFGMMSPEQREALGDAMRVIQLPSEAPREVPGPSEGAEGGEGTEGAEDTEDAERAEAPEDAEDAQDPREPVQGGGGPSTPEAASELPESEGGAPEAGAGR